MFTLERIRARHYTKAWSFIQGAKSIPVLIGIPITGYINQNYPKAGYYFSFATTILGASLMFLVGAKKDHNQSDCNSIIQNCSINNYAIRNLNDCICPGGPYNPVFDSFLYRSNGNVNQYERVCENFQDRGRMMEGLMNNGRLHDERLLEDRLHDGRLHDGRLNDGRLSDGRLNDGRVNDGRFTDGRLSDGRLHDARLLNGRLHSFERLPHESYLERKPCSYTSNLPVYTPFNRNNFQRHSYRHNPDYPPPQYLPKSRSYAANIQRYPSAKSLINSNYPSLRNLNDSGRCTNYRGYLRHSKSVPEGLAKFDSYRVYRKPRNVQVIEQITTSVWTKDEMAGDCTKCH